VSHLRMVILAILALAFGPVGASGQDTAAGGVAYARTEGVLTGKVTSAAGAPLAGVKVKLFEEGFLLNETTTGADGSYELNVDYLPDIDWTVMVWYVAPNPSLLPEILILRESLKSKELGLWSPCLPRLELRRTMSFDVTLMAEEKKLEQMTTMDCMKGEGR
jgi:hypothetical protein